MPTTDPAQLHAAIDALTFWKAYITQPAAPKPWEDERFASVYGADVPTRRRKYLAALDKRLDALQAELQATIVTADAPPAEKPKRAASSNKRAAKKVAPAEPVTVEDRDGKYVEVS
jgi:hypothetical protein